jgi:hypothetical protein
MAIAPYVRKYFWDINPDKAAPKSFPEFYILRILELGDRQAYNWLKTVYGKTKIKKVAKKGPLSPKSYNYWNRVL